ncbi:PASTA domain-containing protein [bacterium]|nr:PASTA domain-containing protein [bacterium]
MRKLIEIFTVFLAIAFLGILGLVVTDKFILPHFLRHSNAVIVPDVEGKSFEEAKKELEQKGFQAIEKEKRFSSLPIGTVTHQIPKPEMETKSGRRVYLSISSGLKATIVPNLVGITQRDALIRIQNNNLKILNIFTDYSLDFQKEVVVKQSLESGSEVPPGTEISITVSLGTPEGEFIVPDLVGLSFEKAKTEAEKSGLKIRKIFSKPDQSMLPNTVIEQFPFPAEKVTSDEEIQVTVSK